MGYFKYLSFGLGSYLLLAWLWIFFSPQQYKNVAESFMPEKRPVWFTVVSALMVLWVGYTWYQFLQFQSALALAISMVFSLVLIKIYFLLFRYEQFRAWALDFISIKDSILRTFAALIMAIGILLLAVGATL